MDDLSLSEGKYNILLIDTVIREKLNKLKETELPKIKDRVRKLNQQLKSCTDYLMQKELNQEIDTLLIKGKQIENKEKLKEYISQSQDIIDKFKSLKPSEVKINQRGELIESYDQYREDLINTYLLIANRYITIRPIKKQVDNQLCSECGINLDTTARIDQGTATCTNCGLIQRYWKGMEMEISKNKTSSSSGNREYYIEAFRKLIGEMPVSFPSLLFNKLDQYFASQGIPTLSQAAKLPLLADGTKKGTSIQILSDGLKALKESDYYKNIHCLAEQYWGWKLDKHLAHLEPEIIKDYDLTQPIIKSLMGPEKKSNMNIQLRLCYAMNRHGSIRKPSYYRMIKSPATLDHYQDILKEAYKQLGWSDQWVTLKEMENRLTMLHK